MWFRGGFTPSESIDSRILFGSFLDHFGSFLEAPHHQNPLIFGSFLDHFGMIFGSFLEARHHHNPLIFRPFLEHFGSFLEAPHHQNPSVFRSFSIILARFWRLAARILHRFGGDAFGIRGAARLHCASGPAPLRQRPGRTRRCSPNSPV